MKRILSVSLFICISLAIFPQTEITKDSIDVSDSDNTILPDWFSLQQSHKDTNPYLSPPSKSQTNMFEENQPVKINLNLPPLFIYKGPPLEKIDTRLPFENDYNYSGGVQLSDGSWISGGGSHQTMLTYGSRRTGSAIYNRRLTNRLTMSAGPTVNQYEIREGMRGRQFSTLNLGGNLDYEINNRMNLSLYGGYTVSPNKNKIGSLIGGYYPESPGELQHSFSPIGQAGLQFNYQVTDWLSVSPGAYGARYESYGYRYDDYGVNGSVGFKVSERIKLNLHGQRSLKGKNQNFGTRDVYSQDYYGGSIEYRFSERFGVEAGVDRAINPFTGKWETKPYIKPIIYVK